MARVICNWCEVNELRDLPQKVNPRDEGDEEEEEEEEERERRDES